MLCSYSLEPSNVCRTECCSSCELWPWLCHQLWSNQHRWHFMALRRCPQAETSVCPTEIRQVIKSTGIARVIRVVMRVDQKWDALIVLGKMCVFLGRGTITNKNRFKGTKMNKQPASAMQFPQQKDTIFIASFNSRQDVSPELIGGRAVG